MNKGGCQLARWGSRLAEGLVHCGDVLVDLGDGAETELAEGEDEGVGEEGVVEAVLVHRWTLGLQATLRWRCWEKVDWLLPGAGWGVWGARRGWA